MTNDSPVSVAACIAPHVEAALARWRGRAPDELYAEALPALVAAGLVPERFSGSNESKWLTFVRDSLKPKLLALGKRGEDAWVLLCDPNTPLHLGRILALTTIIAVAFGVQTFDVSTTVTIILATITLKERRPQDLL